MAILTPNRNTTTSGGRLSEAVGGTIGLVILSVFFVVAFYMFGADGPNHCTERVRSATFSGLAEGADPNGNHTGLSVDCDHWSGRPEDNPHTPPLPPAEDPAIDPAVEVVR